MSRSPWSILTLALICLLFAMPARALDQDHWQKADGAMQRGIAFLRQTQNPDGSWSPKYGPAITALVLSAMLDQPDISSGDPSVDKALAYILKYVHEDGGIHNDMLLNYNTAICVSALSKVKDRPDATAAMRGGVAYLKKMQWASGMTDPTGKTVDESHPFFGGSGYGHHGRPDMSNTQFMLQALHDSGLSCDDPAFQRALTFVSRCQGTASNTKFGDKIVNDGGFIYATSIDRDNIGNLETKAGEVAVETPDGTSENRLQTYGSMTYAGLKSYIYANLDRNDPRVVDVQRWISHNYQLDHNPGMPEAKKLQGHYYYLMTFARALDAWGATYVQTADGMQHDWANDLVDELVSRQGEDGSWINSADRWSESDPNLVTAYALIALNNATK